MWSEQHGVVVRRWYVGRGQGAAGHLGIVAHDLRAYEVLDVGHIDAWLVARARERCDTHECARAREWTPVCLQPLLRINGDLFRGLHRRFASIEGS